jgi:hypothetical protein
MFSLPIAITNTHAVGIAPAASPAADSDPEPATISK